eukprot:7613054-Ditylum_brightwellii.AAC.1
MSTVLFQPLTRKSSSRSQAKPAPKKLQQEKKFPCCGGIDHLCKSSSKCPYNGASKKLKLDMENGEEATTEMEDFDDKNLLSPNFIHVKRKNEPKCTQLVGLADLSFCERKIQFKVQKSDPVTER